MSNLNHIKSLIYQVFQEAGVLERFEENLAITFWESAVGPEIAAHTEPQKVVKGIVFVKVDDDVWRNELMFFKNEIIEKLNQKIGKKCIQEIKFY